MLSSASGPTRHVFMVATRRLPGFEQGMLERLLRLAGTLPRISLAVHEADVAEFRAVVDGLGLAAKVDMIAAPQVPRLMSALQTKFRMSAFAESGHRRFLLAEGETTPAAGR